MTLVRPVAYGRRITLVPLIDVLFILLVYFMVTSVYRDLDMIPVARGAGVTMPAAPASGDAPGADTLLLRIDAGGNVALRGRTLTLADLTAQVTGRAARVLILPSGAAPLHALTRVLDTLTEAGVTNARLVRLEAVQ